jgi:hypothetical protein
MNVLDVSNAEEALKIIAEVERYLARAKVAIEKGEFVHADAWIEAVKTTLDEQDTIGLLAAGELNED